jgi:hypothetical protein
LNTTRSIFWSFSALLLQHLEYVPGDRLALAIGVGCEDELVGALERFGDVIESAHGLRIDLPYHLEIGFRIDRAVLGREVADMAERGQHLVGTAQIFIDRLGLCRRLNNDDIHVIPKDYWEI